MIQEHHGSGRDKAGPSDMLAKECFVGVERGRWARNGGTRRSSQCAHTPPHCVANARGTDLRPSPCSQGNCKSLRPLQRVIAVPSTFSEKGCVVGECSAVTLVGERVSARQRSTDCLGIGTGVPKGMVGHKGARLELCFLGQGRVARRRGPQGGLPIYVGCSQAIPKPWTLVCR